MFLGALGETASPATTFSPMVGAEIRVGRGGSLLVPLRNDFEHAVFVLDGEATLDGEPVVADVLYYLGTSRDEMQLSAKNGARELLLGGAPFGETIVMWWNFVARTDEEIVAAAGDWLSGRRFGRIRGDTAPPMPIPPLRGHVRPPVMS